MCGIFFCLRRKGTGQEHCDISFEELNTASALRCRGPDYCETCEYAVTVQGENFEITTFSSVLSLRDPFTKQPLKSENTGSVLQFNGQIYECSGELTPYSAELDRHSDTELVLQLFERFGVLRTLQNIRGEYAFVFYDMVNHSIWWARDCIGRRSLLMNTLNASGGSFAICSVPPIGREDLRSSWEEVSAGVIYKFDLRSSSIQEYPWKYDVQIPVLTGENDNDYLVYPYGNVSNIKSGTHDRALLSDSLYELMNTAVKQRAFAVHRVTFEQSTSDVASHAVLFSGGIDCTLLVYFLNHVLSDYDLKVDLLNVAFENPRIGGGYDTPDRKLGRQSWKELLSLPEFQQSRCQFRFVEIDIAYSEVLEAKRLIADLIYPKTSVMDFSIAVAFFFSARGFGRLFQPNSENLPTEQYSSAAKVLFSGLGADELFAGYTRHGTILDRNADGYEALAQELEFDFSRLHTRNLGRDDRVGAYWSKDMRYPYLDEDIVAFAKNCPLDYKIQRERGNNGNSKKMESSSKWLLRQLAYRLGLKEVAKEKKRAIQFGARSAKMEPGQGKIKGTDIFTP
ncbi:asparagine synthase-domain-containing protein [Dipodascopsis uninucleata]